MTEGWRIEPTQKNRLDRRNGIQSSAVFLWVNDALSGENSTGTLEQRDLGFYAFGLLICEKTDADSDQAYRPFIFAPGLMD